MADLDKKMNYWIPLNGMENAFIDEDKKEAKCNQTSSSKHAYKFFFLSKLENLLRLPWMSQN